MMKTHFYFFVLFSYSILGFSQVSKLPAGFVDVKEEIPNIVVELRYYSVHNFIGDTIDGYKGNRLILSNKATKQLKKVQYELNERGLGLKVFDSYRPQMAVDHFVTWAKVMEDTLMKSNYYPNVQKKNLFKEGYIASKSGHSRGSTLDLSIVNLKSGEELDMGSPFDFFGPESWVDYSGISSEQKNNRQILQHIMNKYGFRSYPKEWWHFTLRNEPFPETYFNFPIE